jgi:hypothetical protein
MIHKPKRRQKNRNKEQMEQIENRAEYGRC